MTSKEIPYSEFKEAIRVAFSDDYKILDLYDPSERVDTINDVIESVYRKVGTHSDAIIKGVYDKSELIGYFVYNNLYLISFGLSIRFRKRKFLREFNGLIKKNVGAHFECFLFTRNQRAIRWLCKMGMIVNYFDNNLTHLKCQ